MDTDNSRYIVQVFVGALSQHYEALSVEASKLTTSEEIVSCIAERLSLGDSSSGFELAEVVGDTMGRECKERRLGANECPVACMLLWPKINSQQQYYRFYLREKVCESLWSEGFTMDPQLIKDYFYRFLYQPNDREYPDLCQLPDLNEQTLLDNLKARFNAGHIYTYVGSILIAVNPFKFHPIYNPKYVKLYQKRRLGPELPPHIFAVADAAYHSMLKAKKNQCIVISGESGSGKTESTNFLLHHLTALSQKGSHGSGVEQTILSAGPVLEAFGNAKTAHNNNSSRFGKFIQVNYKENGMVHGAVVQKYLLEKSRICSQGRSERNYHVFYYLLAGASDSDRQLLHLLQANQYNYLNRTVGGLDNVDEKYEFSRLKQSMEMVGFTPEKQRRLFGVLSAVLLLGNVEFEVKKFGYHHCDEAVTVRNPDTVKLISDLLRVKEETLLAALTAKRARASGETLVINYRPHEAVAARDAMAKCLYGALFDWIVLQVNHALLSKKDTMREHQGNSIGVLDIFGFEDFGLFNSFEQFCINYANEHLQHYFNQHVFKYEQEEYRKEGIRWRDIDFLDNSPCLALIEGKPNGLLCLLDDQCNFPGASNETLLQKFNSVHKENTFYEMPQKRENAFIVRHYAGKVKYQVVDMREKNVDLMRQDIVGVLKNSSLAFVRELVGADPVAVFRWAIVRAFFRGYFAFHDAGRKHRLTRDGSKPSSIHHRYRNHTPNENLISKNKSFRPRERGKKGLKNLQSVKTLAGRAQSLGQLTKARKHPLTVTAQFQQSLNSLMITLNQANPFFIRCIKSNSDKVANLFDEDVVQRQLRYTGMLETVRIRQAGYNVRLTYDEFIHLYRILLPKGLNSSSTDVGDFLLTLNLNRDNYQVGSSKIFLRESEKVKLDYRLHQQIMASIVTIQRWFRSCLDRQRFVRMRQSAITIQSYWRMYRVSEERKGLHSAAAQIQASWRAFKIWRWYSSLKRTTVSFQASARGYLIRDYVRKQVTLRRAYLEERQKAAVSKESSQEEPESESSGGGGGTHDSESEHGSDTKPTDNIENHISRAATEVERKRSPPKRYWQHPDWRTQSQDSVSSDVFSVAANDASSKLSSGAHSDGETETQTTVWEVRRAHPPRRNRPAGLGSAVVAGGSSVPSQIIPAVSRSVDHGTEPPRSHLNRPSNIIISKAGRRASDPVSGEPTDPITQYSPSADLLEWKGTTMFSIAGHKFRKVSRFSKEDRCAFCQNQMDAFFTQGHKCSDCKKLFHTKCIQNGGVVQLPCTGGSRRGKQSRKRPISQAQRSADSPHPLHQHHNHRAKFNLTGTFEFTDSTDRIISDIKELQSMQEFISNKICKIEADEGEKASRVDRVFKHALKEFKDNLVATYSIANKHSPDTLNIKYKDLISNFLHVMETVCTLENTKEDFPVTMCVNGFRGFMNEWMEVNKLKADKPKKTKRKKEKKRKTEDPIIHFGHSFLLTIINIPTACEVCSSFFMWPIERGLVCQNCKLTCHKKCYTKVVGLCTKDTLTCGRNKGTNTIFGVPLESLATEDGKIPIVVDRLIHTIEIHGLYTEGIYRKPGVNSKVLELKAKMEEGNLDFLQFDKYHVHVLASVLKSFLREMPEPLLTFDHYDDLLRAADLSEDKITTIYAILLKLPQVNFDLLERIVFHLARVALHEEANRMSANALATVFAPCLLRTDKAMRAQDSLQDISRQTACIEVIVMEQMRRLRATLIEIDTLDTACHTVTHRLSSIRSSKIFSAEDFAGSALSVNSSGVEGSNTGPSRLPPSTSAEEEEVILMGHIEEIQKEKALLTSTLPSLTRSPSDDDLLSTDGSLDDVEPSQTLSRHRVIHKHKKRGSEASTSSALTPPDQPPSSDRDPIMV